LSHPLIALASDKEVRQAASFRAKAGELGGERLKAAYEEEKRSAPRLQDAGRRYLAPRGGKPATERRRGKDEEHVATALVRYGLARADGMPLPDDALRLQPLEWVRVRQGPPMRRTKGISRIDLLGSPGRSARGCEDARAQAR
jgi:hypothetical protein